MEKEFVAERPKVGIGLLIVKNNSQILLGERIGSHGSGEFSGVGGHMEFNESFVDTAMREMREEIGENIIITEPKFLCVTNLRKYLPKHYVDIGMKATWISGDPTILEPDKIVSWDWHPINKPPKPLFGATENYITALITGQTYFE